MTLQLVRITITVGVGIRVRVRSRVSVGVRIRTRIGFWIRVGVEAHGHHLLADTTLQQLVKMIARKRIVKFMF